MINVKKIRPLFTKIVTTCDKYETTQKIGSILDTRKTEGSIKEYQKVVAVGTSPAGIKVGDLVAINPIRYAVMKHEDGTMRDGIITDNSVVSYNFPVIELDGVSHLLLETADVEFVIEEYDDPDTLEARCNKAGIYTGYKPIS